MNVKNRVHNLTNTSGKHKTPGELTQIDYTMCKTFGWDYYTLVNQPLPFIFKMIDCINYETYLQKKENDKMDKKTTLPNKTGMRKKG